MCKGGDPDILKLNIKQICGMILRVLSPGYAYNTILFGFYAFKEKLSI